jgi:hypothetical protein
VVAGPDAREWKTRDRRGLPPFDDPDPREVVAAALDLLAAGGRPALVAPDPGPLPGHRR